MTIRENLQKILPKKLMKSVPIIPVVRLEGALINKAPGPMGGKALNLLSVSGALNKAFKNKKADTIAICVNSPGGSPVQSRFIATRIRQLAEENDKKVVVFTEDVAASGGYWIACAGDEIIADPASIVGSIGVVMAGFGLDQAIEKIGIDRRVYTAGENKVTMDGFQPENPKDVKYIQTLLDDMHEQFIEHVKAARGDRLSDDKDIFSGRFWTGRKALELGLVDGLGDLRSVMVERYGQDVKLKLVNAPSGGFWKRFGSSTDPFGTAVASTLNVVEERALWSRFGL